jgi:FAD dependent oxidoreductase
MLNTIFNLPPQQKQKIAIIGSGAMGVSTACILAKLGIANITLFEAESKAFNDQGASINNTGILHHFVYGGHAKTLELLLRQGILFRKLMPPYVFGDNYVNYLVPNHQENTAIYKQGVTFKEISDLLVKFYRQHLIKYPEDCFLGQPEDLVKIMNEEDLKGLFGTDILAIFSGLYYNHAELYFPVDKFQKSLPQEWFQQVEKILGKTESEVLTTIKNDISQWIPWVKELENMKLKKAVQVYPGRKQTNDLEAAKRDDNPIRYIEPI